jgi:hypothetical protein
VSWTGVAVRYRTANAATCNASASSNPALTAYLLVERMVSLMTASIPWVKGWFYHRHGAHRKYREQDQSPRKETAADALILLGVIACVTLTGLLAVMLARGW